MKKKNRPCFWNIRRHKIHEETDSPAVPLNNSFKIKIIHPPGYVIRKLASGRCQLTFPQGEIRNPIQSKHFTYTKRFRRIFKSFLNLVFSYVVSPFKSHCNFRSPRMIATHYLINNEVSTRVFWRWYMCTNFKLEVVSGISPWDLHLSSLFTVS